MDAPAPTEALPSRARDELFKSRTVLIFGEITQALAEAVTRDFLALSAQSAAPIRVVLNSPGGHVESGDTLHDVIRFIEPEVRMLGTGWVASAGALIYAAAKLENRFSLPNTRFMLHQPSGGVSGPASDIEIEAAQVLAVRDRLNRIFATATGRPLEQIERETQRNHWMSAEQALAYGLVGRIIGRASEVG